MRWSGKFDGVLVGNYKQLREPPPVASLSAPPSAAAPAWLLRGTHHREPQKSLCMGPCMADRWSCTVHVLSVHGGLDGLCIADAWRLHGHFPAMQVPSLFVLYQRAVGGATPNGAVETLKRGSRRHNGAESPKELPALLSGPGSCIPPGLVCGHYFPERGVFGARKTRLALLTPQIARVPHP